MKALVTGCAGFVGSTLTRALLRRGWTVRGVDSFTDYYDVSLKQANAAALVEAGTANFELIRADLLTADVAALLQDVDVVFHLAGQPGVRKSWGDDFVGYTDANITVTQRLLEAARRTPSLRRLVYASSSSVYGNAETYPTDENMRPSPMSPYGVTKLAAEHLCVLYAKNFGIPTTSLRFFTVYGPRQRPDMAFTRFFRAAIRGEEITLFGDGSQVRDFTFVDDIVEANILAATVDHDAGSVFNVCGGSSVTVNEVLDSIARISDSALNIVRYPAVPGDVARTGGDNARIASVLGWQPAFGLEAGLRAQSEWASAVFAPEAAA
ncbi:NAD-dependent epimerase/dehydratase family protein [Agromyces sp. C10]|uniref:NAD-dependent epimerase/dehydratase family protein n=1 Tax=Agromyces sp. C10 TaxID=2935077 RepID=UPI00200A4E92|nr:NAD-dependent epimerase/dehydratase family protein [Agromyces sp. C10]MCK8608286.1 NAD-dependent epimerase/dehydratase family protein [Agromyces sp. C10]